MGNIDKTETGEINTPETAELLPTLEAAETREDFRVKLKAFKEQLVDGVRSDDHSNGLASKLAAELSPDEVGLIRDNLGDLKTYERRYEDAVFGQYDNEKEKDDAIADAGKSWIAAVKDNEVYSMALDKFDQDGVLDKVKAAFAIGVVAFGIGFDAGTQAVENTTGSEFYDKCETQNPFTDAASGILEVLEARENGEGRKEETLRTSHGELVVSFTLPKKPPEDSPEESD